eukprot:g8569.t1
MGGGVWLDAGGRRSGGTGGLIARLGVLLAWCCLVPNLSAAAPPAAPSPPSRARATTVAAFADPSPPPPGPRSSSRKRTAEPRSPADSPGGGSGSSSSGRSGRRERRSHRDRDRDGLLPGPAPPPPLGEGGGGGDETVHGDSSAWRAAGVGSVSWVPGIEEGRGGDGYDGGDWRRGYLPAVRGASAAAGETFAGAASAEAAGTAAGSGARAMGHGKEEAARIGMATRRGRDSRAVGSREGPAVALAAAGAAAAVGSGGAPASVDLKNGGAEPSAPADQGEQEPWDMRRSVDRRWGEDRGHRGKQQQQRRQQQQQRRQQQQPQQHREQRHSSLRGSSIPSLRPPPPPPPVLVGSVIGGNSGSVWVESPGESTIQQLEIEKNRGRAGGADEGESPAVSGASVGGPRGDRLSVARKAAPPAKLRESRIRKHLQQAEEEEEEPARDSRALQEESRVFPGGVELECNLLVPRTAAAAGGGPTIIEPAEGDVLVVGVAMNVTWGLDIFEESVVATDGSSGTPSSGSLPSDLDIGTVNITFFNGDDAVWSSLNNSNTGESSFVVPSDLEEARTYRVAVWDTASRICAISSEFGISGELSITVTQFEGYNEEGTVDISPLRQGNTSGGGGEIYSCGGSVQIGWSHTGLLEEVDVRVCKEPNTSGTLAGLQDEDLQLFTCLDPVGDSVPANSSFLNATLTTVEDEAIRETLCAVWGEGFFARVSWAGDGSTADVFGTSDEGVGETTVLGGVFVTPNDSTPISILESQWISWDGRTGVGDDALVDIILRSRASTSDDDFRVVVASNARTATDGKFLWEEPWAVFTEEERAAEETFQFKFYLELFDAFGGGLICRSRDFILEMEVTGGSSSTSTLLLLLTPAALLLLCCCGVFFVACPYYDKIVRRRRNDLRPSLIDVDDTYIIDGEGQPAILALDSHVIPLAHAHYWPGDGSSSSSYTTGHGGAPYILRRSASVNGGHGRGGGGSAGGSSNSPSWARAVLAMGHSVTESIGRAAGLALQTSGGGGGGSSSGGSGAGRGGSWRSSGRSGGQGGGLDDACSGIATVAGRGPSVAGSVEPGSSLSSWRGMRSGATWAFGGGGSIGRRSGGRRDGGGVYPTAAAALGLGLAPHHDLEEKSEAAATGGASGTSVGGSSAASTASNNNYNLDGSGGLSRRRCPGVRGGNGSTAGGGVEGGFFYVAASGGVAGAGGTGTSGHGAVGGSNGAEDGSSMPSSSWYSRPTSRVDIPALLGRAEHNGGSGGGTAESGSAGGTGLGRSGSGTSGTAWLGRFGGGGGGGSAGSGWGGGGGGGHDREKVVTVVVSGVEADQVEIVEVARAVVVDENGLEIQMPTTLPMMVVGMEVMEGFSDHGSFDGGGATSPIHSPAILAS